LGNLVNERANLAYIPSHACIGKRPIARVSQSPTRPGLSSRHISRSRATPSPSSVAELARDSITTENWRQFKDALRPSYDGSATSLIRVVAVAHATSGEEQEELAARLMRKT
jgi:hypothetical protein